MTATSSTCRRELAHRAGDGIDVFLFWDARSNDVSIGVVDQCEESAFELRVDAKSALDAFNRPYAYRSRLEQKPALAAPESRSRRRSGCPRPGSRAARG